MAQISTELLVRERDLIGEQVRGDRESTPSNYPDAAFSLLEETWGLLTPFRNEVFTHIYRMAQELSRGRVIYGELAAPTAPDEEDSVHLDLTLAVDADWDTIENWRADIIARVSERSKDWTEREREDYARWIYFGLVPVRL